MRNNYSCPKGDTNYATVISVAQLRTQYLSNGGWMTDRHKQFLRRMIPPYTDGGTGTATKFVIVIPKKWGLDNIPAEGLAFKPLFSVYDSDFLALYPWIGDSAFAVDDAIIDAELGTELTEDRDSWQV